MNKQQLVRALLPAVIALAVAAHVDAATTSAADTAQRDTKAIHAEMKQLGERMAALATELRAQGDDSAYSFSTSHDGMRTNVATMMHQMHEGAALGIVLGARDTRVFISAVTPGSGAEQAGLRSGDQIVSIRGKALPEKTSVELARASIGSLKAGDSVDLGVKRGGQVLTLTAKATQQPRVLMFGAQDAKLAELRKNISRTCGLNIANPQDDVARQQRCIAFYCKRQYTGCGAKIVTEIRTYFGQI